MRSLLSILLLAAACGSSDNPADAAAPADLAVKAAGPDMALLSRCGHPGDVGNALGVGQFCTNQGPDCSANSKATMCSALFNGQTPSATDTYFCSFQCMATDPPGTCGANAACLCNAANICACIPTTCVSPGDGGA